MKIQTMQKIDFWLGVPLTFLFTLFFKISGFFKPPKPFLSQPVKNILFIELSEMGSIILLTPLLDQVTKEYPKANLYFLTFRSASPVLYTQRIDEDKILTLRTDTVFIFMYDLLILLRILRTIAFDIVFDLELFSRISSLISFFSAARIKVGFDNFFAEGLYRGRFVTHPVTYNTHHHVAKNFLSMALALHEASEEIPHSKQTIPDAAIFIPKIVPAPEKKKQFLEKLLTHYPILKNRKKWILLNPNSSQTMPLRRWPLTSYVGLARKLLDIPSVALLLIGAPDEKADTAFICSQLNHPDVIDLSGFTSIKELILLFHSADLLISNDSGPPHFAALAHLKTITFFGPETPALYGPLNPNSYNFYKQLQCSPCYSAYNQRRSPCKNNICLQEITVEEVYAKTKEMLVV